MAGAAAYILSCIISEAAFFCDMITFRWCDLPSQKFFMIFPFILHHNPKNNCNFASDLFKMTNNII